MRAILIIFLAIFSPLLGADADNLIGTWKLVSWQVIVEHEPPQSVFGSYPKGFLILTREGRVKSRVMRRPTNLLLGSALIVTTAAVAADKSRNAAVVGIWRGELDNIPAVTLNITDESGPLQGAMLFYLIRRTKVNHPHHLLESLSAVQSAIRWKSFTFQLSHRHAPRTPRPIRQSRSASSWTGPDEAKLVRIPQEGPLYVRMVREKR